ncbi:uncharacterized protein PgNI_02981, partial [Pyricularia grisea]|uniref:Fe2OG dioxygenase domain-containing protein n=1 Tax=Pyricularia grisea TaxID=148305 RepID=A0A6P8B8Z0_PYRGI
ESFHLVRTSIMSKKRTIDSFFGSSTKKQKTSNIENEQLLKSEHSTYPFPIIHLPHSISKELASYPAVPARAINNQPELDLLYFEPYIPPYVAKDLFDFLRSNLPFYRVEYTTVFGLDDTSRFDEAGNVVDAKTSKPVPPGAYARYKPRPIPECLDALRRSTEAATGCVFNFCLVNYYASGADSISYHSDDERFLGRDPAIASFSLGAKRDFMLKHKAAPPGTGEVASAISKPPLKLPLAGGDMVLMRGPTQANWLHSIPKRSGKNEKDGGRINITFRRAMVKAGTDNYYNYNVGNGSVYVWDKVGKEMVLWKL